MAGFPAHGHTAGSKQPYDPSQTCDFPKSCSKSICKEVSQAKDSCGVRPAAWAAGMQSQDRDETMVRERAVVSVALCPTNCGAFWNLPFSLYTHEA